MGLRQSAAVTDWLQLLECHGFTIEVSTFDSLSVSATAVFVGPSGHSVDAVRDGLGQSDHFRSMLCQPQYLCANM